MEYPIQWILGLVLIISSLGVILYPKPVHASLSFLLTLLSLAAIYVQLSAQFIAVMQVLVYAGAILVLFMFVILLFQDAYLIIQKEEPKSTPLLLYTAGAGFLIAFVLLGKQLLKLPPSTDSLPPGYGNVEPLGRALYLDFFFPFEAVTLVFLVAVVGALYIGKKVR